MTKSRLPLPRQRSRNRKNKPRRNANRAWLAERLEQRIVLSSDGLLAPAFDHDHELVACDFEVVAPPPDATAGAGEAGATTAGGLAAALSETFNLNSNPGAAHTIYLDFDGHVTSGVIWNSSYNGGADIVTAAYDFDGNTSAFSDAELERIQRIWQRTAEDYIPFDVNVTTADPGAAALTKSGSGDSAWGVRVVIGGSSSDWYGSSAGGVAYVGSFNWSTDTPAFVFEAQLGNGAEKYTAEAASHEAGHTLGLSHDGRTSPAETYYAGHGSGDTGWAPIMGNGYYKNLTQWSQGEYLNANRTQDDLAIIAGNNGFGFRADDAGNDHGSASSLGVVGGTVNDNGIIEQNTDIDVFAFSTDAGTIQLDVGPQTNGPNLDVLAQLYNASHTLIASSNPAEILGANINATVTAGQYFLHISGTGKGDPLGSGYTDYGSLGQYWISGTIAPVSNDFLSIDANDAQRAEGDSGSTAFTFTVTRTGNVDGATTVDYTITGTTANAADFLGGVLPSGAVVFSAGETSKSITINVAGDLEIENDEAFTVTLSNASGDAVINQATADGQIQNDDVPATPGIVVTPTSGLTTRETGTSASFSVVLMSRPTADVLIRVSSLDVTEGTANKSVLTFTADNWDVQQVVTVTGVDDTTRDGNVTYTIDLGIAESTDVSYAGLDADDVQVTNQDNDKRGGGKDNPNKGGKKKAAVVEGAAAVVGETDSAERDGVSQVLHVIGRRTNAVDSNALHATEIETADIWGAFVDAAPKPEDKPGSQQPTALTESTESTDLHDAIDAALTGEGLWNGIL